MTEVKTNKYGILQNILLFLFVFLLIRLVVTITLSVNKAGKIYTNETYNEFITIKGSVDGYVIDYVENRINNIPKKVVENFIADGGKIYITNIRLENFMESNRDQRKYQSIGFYREISQINEKSIWLSASLYDIDAGVTEHEFGHYLDYKYNYKNNRISEREFFTKFIENEKVFFKENINGFDYYDSNKEYFAECFSVFCNNPKRLKKYCPITYNIIESAIEGLPEKLEDIK